MLSPQPADDELGNKYLHYDEVPFYMMPFSDDAVTYYPPGLCKFELVVEASGALIGRVFRYNNYHMLLEGLVLEHATDMHVAEYSVEILEADGHGTDHIALQFLAHITPNGAVKGCDQAQVKIWAPAYVATKREVAGEFERAGFIVIDPPQRPGAGRHHIRHSFADVDIRPEELSNE